MIITKFRQLPAFAPLTCRRKNTFRQMLVERVASTNRLVFPGKGPACDKCSIRSDCYMSSFFTPSVRH
ncbi:unnamed protein product [Blumeria hordei]|uniref:Uncharacterized protein n=2 Tax=Blumeria hordei TaxID=2867405 RepID=A0A383UJM9_BLUHO|nr:putative Bgh-specific peptide [Blumeria hordei DH14]SZE99999.1 unnamed protein product [Blumeria hordei]